jgi:protoporphyrinogen oxidase
MIVILGAGLTGLSTGYHLLQAGRDDFALYEREERPCGLVRSHKVGPFTFDFTGHFLHLRDPAIKQLASQWLGNGLPEIARSSWIFSRGVYTRYPFQTNTYGLPIKVVKECVLGYIQARYEYVEIPQELLANSQGLPKPEHSFEQWIYENFGPGIAKHFMIPYNDKLWGIHPRHMSTDWMGRFVPPAPLEAVIEGALTDATTSVGYNTMFRYPSEGGIETFGRELALRAGKILCEHEAVEIDTRKRQVTFSNGEKVEYEVLISTLPLPEICARLKKPLPEHIGNAAAKLRWSSVFALNLGLQVDLTEGRHWVYIPERKFGFYRVGCFSNAAPAMAPDGHVSVWVETSYNAGRPIDRRKARSEAIEGLKAMGWLRSQRDIAAEWLLDIPYAYVTFDANHAEATGAIHRFLEQHNIHSTGRYGCWEYSSMEDAILHGRAAAYRLLGINEAAAERGVDFK